MKNRLIIFDFFGVLGGEISPRWFRNHFPLEEAVALKDMYLDPADLGEYSVYDVIHKLSINYSIPEEDIKKEWKSYAKRNDELFDYILKLRKNNKVALLSNASEGIFDLIYPTDFNKYFDKAFISCEHKMKKPDVKFYELCVNSFDTKFDEIYMIDDNTKNLNHLGEIGIHGIQYKNNQELFRLLDLLL